jgi:hypothetical protein
MPSVDINLKWGTLLYLAVLETRLMKNQGLSMLVKRTVKVGVVVGVVSQKSKWI